MRVIARRTLIRFVESLQGRQYQGAVRDALEAWYHEARRATWRNPAEVRQAYGSASFVGDRVVFNIKGNDYRLVVAIDYHRQITFIKWIGSHEDYDSIDVGGVAYGD